MTRNNTKWSICIRIHSLVILHPSRTICFSSCSMLFFCFTSRASLVTAREVDWPCLAQLYVFGCTVWTRCWPWTNQQTESRPFLIYAIFQFVFVGYDRYNGSKKCKGDHNLPLKEWKKAGSQFVCTCCPNTRLNFRWRTVRLSGASQKCHFSQFFCRNHLTYTRHME